VLAANRSGVVAIRFFALMPGQCPLLFSFPGFTPFTLLLLSFLGCTSWEWRGWLSVVTTLLRSGVLWVPYSSFWLHRRLGGGTGFAISVFSFLSDIAHLSGIVLAGPYFWRRLDR